MEIEETIIKEEQLKGLLSVKFPTGKTFNDFCEKYFNNYDPKQFDAIAIRFFYGNETIVTLYALDKFRQQGTNYETGKVPVKKFKTTGLSLRKILPFIRELNFTLTAGNYSLEGMQVINK